MATRLAARVVALAADVAWWVAWHLDRLHERLDSP